MRLPNRSQREAQRAVMPGESERRLRVVYERGTVKAIRLLDRFYVHRTTRAGGYARF